MKLKLLSVLFILFSLSTFSQTSIVMVDDVTVTEGVDLNAEIIIILSNPSDSDVLITLNPTAGSADGADFSDTSIQVTIPANETRVEVDIPINDDNISEPTETFSIVYTINEGNAIASSPAIVTILEGVDDLPMLMLSNVTVVEGTDNEAVIPVRISNPSSENIVISITDMLGSAGLDDYVDPNIEVTILAGSVSTEIRIEIINDNIDESTEYFTIVSSIVGGNVTNSSPATITIIDDPTDVPTIFLGDVTVTEGVDPEAVIPVSLSNPSDIDVVVTVTTTNGSSGIDDYVETLVTVTIPAGETMGEVSIGIVDDNIDEGTETFTVVGTSPDTNNTSSPATVTILDGLDVPTLFFLDIVTINEELDSQVAVTIAISNPNVNDIGMVVSTADGSATDGNDYTGTTSTVTIPAGETSVNVIINIIDDNLIEGTETFSVNGTVTSGNVTNPNFQGVVTILDGETSNSIKGKVTVDVNADNCASGIPTSNFNIKAVNSTGNVTYYATPNSIGDYNLIVGTLGAFISEPILPNGYVSSPVNYSNTFTIGNQQQDILNQDFCITTNNPGDNVKIFILPMTTPRPGFTSSYKLKYENIGSTIVSGDITLTYEDNKMSFIVASPSETSSTNDSLTWNYTDLQPFETKYIDIDFVINTPTDVTNPVNGGDLLNFNTSITPLTSDVDQTDNEAVLVETVVNSYDPNDATIIEGPEISSEQATKDLNFRIRFQNTGSASAININIKTLLDAHLDWSTFQLLSSSHSFSTSFNNITGEVIFYFPNINLPDSTTDEPGSNGWVFFKAKPKNTFEIGDVISATADIFFDFNAPITTNTATTQIEANLSVEDEVFSNIKLYPNPTSSELIISGNNTFSKYSIYDIQGREFLSKNLQSEIIKVNNLKEGIYFLRLSDGQSFKTYKFIKK